MVVGGDSAFGEMEWIHMQGNHVCGCIRVDGRTGGWRIARMNGWIDGWMDGLMDGWMNVWMERMDGWVGG